MGVAPQKLQKPRPPKKLKGFLSIDNEKRRNPQAIRRMIHDLIVRYYESDCERAASRLSALRVQHKGRNYKTSITQDALYAAVRDKHWIRYLLLEAIAIERRVPVSLLLLYTRLCADQSEDDAEEKVDNLIRGLTLVLQDARAKVNRRKKIDFDDLAHWVNIFVALSAEKNMPDESEVVDVDPNQPMLPGLDFSGSVD